MALMPDLDDDDDAVTVEKRDFPPSHLLVKFESFSRHSENGIDKYESSEFESGDCKWKLILYTNGEDHIAASLAVADTTFLPTGWEFNAVFSIFLYNQKLDYFLSMRGQARRFHVVKPEWGFLKFIEKKTLMDPSNGYLVNDCCVFGAEVFVLKSRGIGEVLSLMDDGGPHKHEIRILNFSGQGSRWSSEYFIAGDHKWQVLVYPKGDGEYKGHSFSVFLTWVSSTSSIRVRKLKADYTICVKDQANSAHSKKNGSAWFQASQNTSGFFSLLPVADINGPEKGFVVENCCIIEVEITIKAVLCDLYGC